MVMTIYPNKPTAQYSLGLKDSDELVNWLWEYIEEALIVTLTLTLSCNQRLAFARSFSGSCGQRASRGEPFQW